MTEIDRIREKELLGMLQNAKRERYFAILSIKEPEQVKRARKIVAAHERMVSKHKDAQRAAIDRDYQKVREKVLFGADLPAALKAVKAFAAR